MDITTELKPEEVEDLQKNSAPEEKITTVRAYRKFLKAYYDVNPGIPPYWIRQELGKLHPRDVIKVTKDKIEPMGKKVARIR